MLVRLLATCLAALMIQSAATAQEAEPERGGDLIILYGKWPAEGECTPENTTPITFSDLLRDKASFADKCVSTVAWLSGRALFLERDDLNLPYSNSDSTAVISFSVAVSSHPAADVAADESIRMSSGPSSR